MKTLSQLFDQSRVSQTSKYLNQQIVIDYICMKIIHHNKSIAKNDWPFKILEWKSSFTKVSCYKGHVTVELY